MQEQYVVINGVIYPKAFHGFGWRMLVSAVGASEVRHAR